MTFFFFLKRLASEMLTDASSLNLCISVIITSVVISLWEAHIRLKPCGCQVKSKDINQNMICYHLEATIFHLLVKSSTKLWLFELILFQEINLKKNLKLGHQTLMRNPKVGHQAARDRLKAPGGLGVFPTSSTRSPPRLGLTKHHNVLNMNKLLCLTLACRPLARLEARRQSARRLAETHDTTGWHCGAHLSPSLCFVMLKDDEVSLTSTGK